MLSTSSCVFVRGESNFLAAKLQNCRVRTSTKIQSLALSAEIPWLSPRLELLKLLKTSLTFHV